MARLVRLVGVKSMGFFLRLWHGNVRLVITFWVFGVLTSALIGIPLGILSLMLRSPGLVYVIIFPVTIFQSVAIWRSANRYPGPTSNKKLAQMSVALGVLFTVLFSLPDLFPS